MKTAVIYARYSSERQTEQSIEGQLSVCHKYAEENDILIVDTYIDRAMTGTNDLRDAFQQMMRDSSKQAWDYVLVYKLDRFSRDKYEATIHKHTLKEHGIKLVSAMENIPETPEGIILESLLEGMNQYFSMELSQKVKRGMNESRKKGNFTGGSILFGYKVINKKLVVDEDQAAVVRYIFEQYANNVYVKDIMAELNERGILNRGKPFARNTVYNLLKNEKYAGIYRHGDEVFTNIYPRIVPDNVFSIVRNKLEEMHYGKHDSEAVYLLKGKLICGYCGNSIASESGTTKAGVIKRYYKCSNRKIRRACNKSVIRKEVLEKVVVDTTLKVLNNPDLIANVADKLLEAIKRQFSDQSTLNLLIKEKQQVQKSIDNLLDAIAEGIRTNSTKFRMEELEKKLDTIESKIAIEKSKERSQITRSDIIRYVKMALKKEPRQMIRLLIKQIILYDDKIEIYYNFTDKKRPEDIDHQVFSFYSTHYEESFSTFKFTENRVPAQDDILIALDIVLFI